MIILRKVAVFALWAMGTVGLLVALSLTGIFDPSLPVAVALPLIVGGLAIRNR